jgi:NCS1 family nucleobase:cation symporter-1
VDYFLVRRRELAVEDLYLRGRRYEFSGGVNYRALCALASGIAVALLGLVVPPLRWMYDYAWFVGFLVAGAVHYLLAVSRQPSAISMQAE